MSKKIYVGNLSFSTTEETLQNTFAEFGTVNSVSIIKDKVTEQSKGFGFVELEEEEGAMKAISTLNGKELDGRRIRVNEAQERQPRRDFGGHGDNRGGYGNRGRDNHGYHGNRNDYHGNRGYRGNSNDSEPAADNQY